MTCASRVGVRDAAPLPTTPDESPPPPCERIDETFLRDLAPGSDDEEEQGFHTGLDGLDEA